MADSSPIERARKVLLEELPDLVREYIDTARAEGTTQAFDRLMGFALKGVDGLQVDAKAGQYANLPVIHVSFGPGMQLTVEPQPAPLPLMEEVPSKPASPFQTSRSAQFDTLPDDVTDLLPREAPTPAELAQREVLAALESAAGAMALPDD